MTSRRTRVRFARARRRMHWILESGFSDPVGRLVHRTLIVLVAASVGAVILESVPELEVSWGGWFTAIEAISVAIFTLEYAARLWTAPEQTPYAGMHPGLARWHYATTASAIVDLLSIAPIYLAVIVPADLRVLLLLRLLRFFKLARYSPGMRSLVAALEAERKALAASAVVLFGLVLIAAAAMHLAEHAVQPDKFGSIPASMWWAVVTLTTVGYGDVVPTTVIGRIIASFTMLMGLMMLALPIGIVSTAFAEEIHRREFVVTWAMLARVPLFAGLSAVEIADVMTYLRAKTVPAGLTVVRKGEAAQCMYFVAEGAVEVEAASGPVRLGEGDFFGEMALLRRSRRSATVRTLTATKLLVLDTTDLHALMERNAALQKHISAVASARARASAESEHPAPAGNESAD